jgi:uncharacterized protein YciI
MTEAQGRLFIYQLKPVRPEFATDPDSHTEEEARVVEEHLAYLERGTKEGTVLLAGRAQDGVGPAIVIIRCASEDDAARFMKGDPFVASGVAQATLHPWRTAFLGKLEALQ